MMRTSERSARPMKRGLAVILFAIALVIAVLVVHVATLPVRPENWPPDFDPQWIKLWTPVMALVLFCIGIGVAYGARWLWGGSFSQFNFGRMASRFYWCSCGVGVLIPYLCILAGLTSVPPAWPYTALIVGAFMRHGCGRGSSRCDVCRDGSCTDGAVELRRGAVPLYAVRFPSPLIEPDVRISRIRLSDWLHREHAASVDTSVMSVSAPPWLHDTACSESFRNYAVLYRLAPSHPPSPSSTSTPEVRVLSSTGVTQLHRYYDPVRTPARADALRHR